MTDKELIKQEIERMKEHTAKCGYPGQGEFENGNREGRNYVCDKLLSFIDSLPEEPESDDLEEEIERFLDEDENIPSYSKTARHFAEWGRNHFEDKSEMASEDLEEYYKKEFLPNEWFAKSGQRTVSEFNFFTAKHFAEWQKRQMMKNAVDAIVHKELSNKYIKEQDKDAFDKALANFDDGDRVKIIIIKEEK